MAASYFLPSGLWQTRCVDFLQPSLSFLEKISCATIPSALAWGTIQQNCSESLLHILLTFQARHFLFSMGDSL